MTLTLVGHGGPSIGDDVGPSSVTVPLPSGVQPGDWCFLHFAGRGNTTGLTSLDADPGWFPISTQEEGIFVSGTVKIVNQVWNTILNEYDIEQGDVTVTYEEAFDLPIHPMAATAAFRPITEFSGFTIPGNSSQGGNVPVSPVPLVPSFVISAKATAGGSSAPADANGFTEIYASTNGGGAPVSIAMYYILAAPGGPPEMIEWSNNSAWHSWGMAVEPTPDYGWTVGSIQI